MAVIACVGALSAILLHGFWTGTFIHRQTACWQSRVAAMARES